MNTLTRRLVTATATAALTAGLSAGLSPAANADPGPCDAEHQEVADAQAAVDEAHVVLVKKRDKVKRARAADKAAVSDKQEKRARTKLINAKKQKEQAQYDKQVQQQRLTEAEEQLAACEGDD